MPPKKYFFHIITFLILLSISVISINYFIDPFLLFDMRRVEGINLKKSAINNYIPISKAYHPLQKYPDTLIVGNSRVEMGLNPRHKCFAELGMKTYNLGIPGIGVGRQLTYAINLINQKEIREVFLALDFTDFLTTNQKQPVEKPELSPVNVRNLKFQSDDSLNPVFKSQRLLDYYRAIFSLDSLVNSIKTLLNQAELATDRDDFGFNPANDFRKVTTIEGPHALFAQKLNNLEKKYSRQWYLEYEDGTLPDEFIRLRNFLVTAKQQNIRVTLFTNPLHDEFWRLMQKYHHRQTYRDWLTAITELLADMGDESVILWDFSYDSPYIHETIPQPGEKTQPLKWFWEPAHYRKELGDLMLETMLSRQCNSNVVFGKRIQYHISPTPD